MFVCVCPVCVYRVYLLCMLGVGGGGGGLVGEFVVVVLCLAGVDDGLVRGVVVRGGCVGVVGGGGGVVE